MEYISQRNHPYDNSATTGNVTKQHHCRINNTFAAAYHVTSNNVNNNSKSASTNDKFPSKYNKLFTNDTNRSP